MLRCNFKQVSLVSAMVLALSACGPKVMDEPVDGAGADTQAVDMGDMAQGSDVNAADSSAWNSGGVLGMEALDDPASALATRIIYFDYDSPKVKTEDMNLISQHGQFLATHADVRVRLEGHADERGSQDYNLALADKRAQEVKRLLLLQGVQLNQVETISYGEERPAEMGHSEEAWSMNRRVEIVYVR